MILQIVSIRDFSVHLLAYGFDNVSAIRVVYVVVFEEVSAHVEIESQIIHELCLRLLVDALHT